MSNKRFGATVKDWGALLGAIATLASLGVGIYNTYFVPKEQSSKPTQSSPPKPPSGSTPSVPSNISDTDQELIERGIAKMESQNYKEAIQIFDQVLQNNATIPKAYLLRAAIYSRFNYCQKALDNYTQAIQNTPETHEIAMSVSESRQLSVGQQPTYFNRGDLLYLRSAIYLGLKDRTSAIRDLQQASDFFFDQINQVNRSSDDSVRLENPRTLSKTQRLALLQQRRDDILQTISSLNNAYYTPYKYQFLSELSRIPNQCE